MPSRNSKVLTAEKSKFTKPGAQTTFFTIDRLHLAAFDVVIAAIEHLAYLGDFLQVPGHRVFHEIIGGAPALRCQFVRAGFSFRLEMHVHPASGGSPAGSVKP